MRTYVDVMKEQTLISVIILNKRCYYQARDIQLRANEKIVSIANITLQYVT